MKKRIFAGLILASMLISVIPNVFADEINETYDDIKFTNTCETAADGVTLNDGAPDGSKYYTTGGTDLYGDAAEYRNIGGIEADTSEDYMWEADIKFDALYSGFTIKDKANKKVDTCIRRYDEEDGTSKLAVQTGGEAYTRYDVIDAEAWYHITLIGQYGTTAPLKMEVYKWEDGNLTLVNEYDNINKRNNVAAAYLAIQPNTSVDNVKITKLGADTLTVSTLPADTAEINAGSSVNMQFTATRNGRDINKPEVEWKVFENGDEITDESVTVSAAGELKAAVDCADKTVTVKAISVEKGNVEGSYDLTIKAVNLDNEKFDTLSLSADNDYVREGEPLSLTVSATKNGENVDLSDGDIVWEFYNEDNIQEIGNQYISVKDNTLYVTNKVISQKIVVHAESASGVVSASLPVTVKATDAVDVGETGTKDRLLVSDACEKIIDGVTINQGSWDSSHYYYFDKAQDMANVGNVTEDIIIEADIKFTQENSGIKLRNNGNTKEGGQIAFQGNKIGRIASGNKFNSFANGDTNSWYHIEIVARCGSDNSYGKAYIYKYDENGNRVNPDDSTSNKPAEGTLDLRTMSAIAFNHIELQPGTGIDNIRIMKLVPDDVTLSLSANTVFAGGNVQASYSVSRKGAEIPSFPVSRLNWAVYDADDKYPADTDLITIDPSGLVTVDATASEQKVYIRVTLSESGIYQSLPLEIKGSDIFTVTGFGVNEENTAITELKVEKNFFYSGDVVFVVAMYDTNGVLMNVAIRNMRDNTLAVSENKISIDDVELPEDFGSVKAMVWTSLGN
ncbi:MAG: hypothetical protein Q4G33_12990 [bacterium]|nr:hypothetical protein [bacterium]